MRGKRVAKRRSLENAALTVRQLGGRRNNDHRSRVVYSAAKFISRCIKQIPLLLQRES